MIYHQFLVKEFDRFDADNYPQIQAELSSMKVELAKAPADYREEILLAHLRSEPIDPGYVDSNPALIDLIRSEVLPSRSIEAMFSSCRHNPAFCSEFENYVRVELRNQLA